MSSAALSPGPALVVGAGPLIGAAVAQRFARQGRAVTVIARKPATVSAVAREIGGGSVLGLSADVTHDAAITAALDEALATHGVPDVVVYNAALVRPDRIGDLTSAELGRTLAVNALGALTVAGHVAPRMAARGNGSLLFTGGMPQVKPDYVSLSLGKAALRTVADLLDAEYGPSGLHVATVTVYDAVVRGTAYDPDLIAEEFATLHDEPPTAWRHEVEFRQVSS